MPDKVKPIKLESPVGGGTETDLFPTEVDPAEDYLACKGIALENSDDTRLEAISGASGYYDLASGSKSFKSLKEINLTFSSDLRPYVRVTGGTYTVVSYFRFRGTNELATPNTLKFVLSVSGSGVTGNCRLFDLTHSQIIATQAVSSTTPAIYNASASNWPTAEAIFEVQLQKTGGGGSSDVRIHGLDITW